MPFGRTHIPTAYTTCHTYLVDTLPYFTICIFWHLLTKLKLSDVGCQGQNSSTALPLPGVSFSRSDVVSVALFGLLTWGMVLLALQGGTMSVETLIINELGPKKPLNLAAMKNLHCPFQCAIVHALLLIVRLSDVNIFHGLIAITPGSRDPVQCHGA